MRWRGRAGSGNIEDRRGLGRPLLAGGGIGGVIVVIAALLFGVDPGQLLNGGGGGAPAISGERGVPGDEAGRFVAVVLAETDSTWSRIFAARGADYPEPTLVLFSDAVQSACGVAGSATGPFYCPRDERVYIDLSFYAALRDRLGAPGDFAQAYVIAHEVGHHVQDVTGGGLDGPAAAGSEVERNRRSVAIELQADCYAGVFASDARARGLLEPGDIDEALGAAAAVGDDRLQMQAQGYVVPESFTHGTAEQRSSWFRRGLESGDPGSCDTGA